jgi:heptosyltransferase-1
VRVLVVKTSSLGDVIHTLPALSDAGEALSEITFDWVVEQAFSEVPGWHPAVDRVIPVSIRQWRKHPLLAWKSRAWHAFKQQIGAEHYDAVIDAQGLLKSAWLTRYCRGPVFGLDSQSAREPLASRFYQHKIAVAKGQHAVERVRQLFARSLGYAYQPQSKGRYKLSFNPVRKKQVVLLHGTTWATKHWSEAGWGELARLLNKAGYEVLIPWGNEAEQQRAQRVASQSGGKVLDKLTLTELAEVIAGARACVSVDTGLGHLAAAVNTPTIALFGPTDPTLTGFYGDHQQALKTTLDCAPCMSSRCHTERDFSGSPPCLRQLTPEKVFEHLSIHLDAVEVAG